MTPKMKWPYCSKCKWNDKGPNIYKGSRCPKCGDLLLILEGSVEDILKIYDYIKIYNLSLIEYLEENIIRNILNKEEYII
jgi:DNA-directed RNA polymerase subunit RPC12/RpoP